MAASLPAETAPPAPPPAPARRQVAPSQLGLAVEDHVARVDARNDRTRRELGALVSDVTPASLGAVLGIRRGDLLVAVGGRSVASASEVRAALATLVDTPVRVTVRRGAVRMDLTLED